MGYENVLNDVPEEGLEEVVASFKRDGATEVKTEKQANGKYKVTAKFPNGPQSGSSGPSGGGK